MLSGSWRLEEEGDAPDRLQGPAHPQMAISLPKAHTLSDLDF